MKYELNLEYFLKNGDYKGLIKAKKLENFLKNKEIEKHNAANINFLKE